MNSEQFGGKMEFKEKYGPWALITGASAGLGKEFAIQLAEMGMNVILTARRESKLQDVAKECQNIGVETQIISADLLNPEAPKKIAQEIGNKEIGLLVNNAGFGVIGAFWKADAQKQIDMTYLNCVAVVAVAREFLPQIVKRGRGGIITVSSVAGFQPTPFFTNYGATKAFDLMLGEGIWAELRRTGVDALTLCPGYTATEFQQVAGVNPNDPRIYADPKDVIRGTLKALGKKQTYVPQFRNKIMALGYRLFPRKIVTLVTMAMMKKLGRNHKISHENVM